MPTQSPLLRLLALMLIATLLVTQSVPTTPAVGLRSTVVVGSLQAAVDAAIPGDTLLLRQTVYS